MWLLSLFHKKVFLYWGRSNRGRKKLFSWRVWVEYRIGGFVVYIFSCSSLKLKSEWEKYCQGKRWINGKNRVEPAYTCLIDKAVHVLPDTCLCLPLAFPKLGPWSHFYSKYLNKWPNFQEHLPFLKNEMLSETAMSRRDAEIKWQIAAEIINTDWYSHPCVLPELVQKTNW